MFQSWRFQLRKVEETLKSQRLDEAVELLMRNELTEYLPGQRLAARLAAQLVARGRQHAEHADWQAACRDLAKSLELGGQTRQWAAAQQEILDAGRRAVEQRLAAGDTNAALDLLDKFTKQTSHAQQLNELRQVAQRLQSAEKLARCGRFADADAQLSAAASLAPGLAWLQERRRAVGERLAQSRPLTELLHRALSDSDWSEALTAADQLLELAPDCRLARDARRKAWQHAGAHYSDSLRLGVTQPYVGSTNCAATAPPAGVDRNRFVLWVDGVGGFLVCLHDQIVLGQARAGTTADIPILADLSQSHIRISRGGEGYWLEPFHLTRINRRAVQTKTLLRDGDELELGSGVRLKFRRPHALSASARLEFLSRHRTLPSADGVLLMAESCVLGPQRQNHVVCRHWAGDVVLYRHDDHLCCRAMEPIEIDGELCDGQGRLAGNSHVVGSDFSMSLEELDRCSTQPLL